MKCHGVTPGLKSDAWTLVQSPVVFVVDSANALERYISKKWAHACVSLRLFKVTACIDNVRVVQNYSSLPIVTREVGLVLVLGVRSLRWLVTARKLCPVSYRAINAVSLSRALQTTIKEPTLHQDRLKRRKISGVVELLAVIAANSDKARVVGSVGARGSLNHSDFQRWLKVSPPSN